MEKSINSPRAAPPDTWRTVDPLGEVLHHLRMSSVFYTRSEFTDPWGLELPPIPNCLMFHAVTSGSCLLEVGDSEPHLLRPGSFALVPHGNGHRLLGDTGCYPAPLFDLEREQVSERYEILRHGGGGKITTMICGAVRLDHPVAHRLLRLLPELVVIDTWQSAPGGLVHSTLRLMAIEAERLQPGGETIITRLSDILVIQAIRSWMESNPSPGKGWLSALNDPQVGRALLAVHRDPESPWTVTSMAKQAAMSRSAFAARFNELVGETPIQFVRQWKMHVAQGLLLEGATVGSLAGRMGYESEAAFSRAFKKTMGVSPGAVRRESRLFQPA